jgi:hypothetical protein
MTSSVEGRAHRLNGQASPAWFALAVDQTGPRQTHAVVLYRSEGQIHEMHFCDSEDFRAQEAGDDYLWFEPEIEFSEALAFAALCDLIAERRDEVGGLPFAFRYDASTVFDSANGQLLMGAAQAGFSCSTFVLTLLASYNVRPIDLSTWRSRPCDVPWQKKILRHIAGDRDAQALPQAAEVGSHRYRPEEVVGTSCSHGAPAEFSVALARGRDILAVLGVQHIGCHYDAQCSIHQNPEESR